MIKVSVQYINDLDNKYEAICQEIEETITDFNGAIIKFIRDYNSNKEDKKKKKKDSEESLTEKEEKDGKDGKDKISKDSKSGSGDFNIEKMEKNDNMDDITTSREQEVRNKNLVDPGKKKKIVKNKLVKNEQKEENCEAKATRNESAKVKENIETKIKEEKAPQPTIPTINQKIPKHQAEEKNRTYENNSNFNTSNRKNSNKKAEKPHNTSVDLYTLPKLSFSTKNKYIRKFYKRLIVKLHPDKTELEDKELFSTYYKECKSAVDNRCLYKLWLISKKIGVNIKVNMDIELVFLKEVNTLKKYIDDLGKSEIYNWIHTHEEKYIFLYIKNTMHVI